MSIAQPADHDRLKGALAAILVQLAIGYALVVGLAFSFPQPVDEAMKMFVVPRVPAPPVEAIPPAPRLAPKSAGAASPPNLKAKATELVVPPLVIPPPLPPPVVVALKPGTGAAPNTGASLVRGPGSGAGGVGEGTGSGGQGDGIGGGGNPLRQIAGRITGRDYPERPYRAGIGGTLYVRYVVGVHGRVSDCSIVRSSGNAELDSATCRLLTERFRYKPRRDAAGKPVPTVITEDHTWVVDRPQQTEEGVPEPGPDTP